MTATGAHGPAAGAIVVWFRQDLRLADNPALEAACRAAAGGASVVPVFVWSPEEEGAWPPGAASRWWLHHSLTALDAALRRRGSRLLVRRGPIVPTLLELARDCGASALHWNRRYEPAGRAQGEALKRAAEDVGLATRSFNGALLAEPWEVATGAGRPYQVFTPFWRAFTARGEPDAPDPAPDAIPAPAAWPGSDPIDALALLPHVDWAGGLRAVWTPGEAGARRQLEHFAGGALADYADGRNRPDQEGSSRLSPFLHFGEISPRQVWHAVRRAEATAGRRGMTRSAESYLRELGWREFAYHLLFHFPHTPAAPLRAEYADFPWREDRALLRAWRRGRTGYPFVDAGMRQLWRTGWMHNRTRMVVASFLVKDLLISWSEGAAWFWDTLVDADLANNTLGWQWAGGCGADAAPFFRVFNPVTQGLRFDPAGDYVREHVAELAGVAGPQIHEPWSRSGGLPGGPAAGGTPYPERVVDHAMARDRALAALATWKGGA
ncbi:MAG: DNA photolyase family protein [Acidobacteria bacterium]|jgi:deoxyribodipyrimidine photo-lyase|nr:DNA photolyase family protein [Acidobacteriota bacterium]MCU0253382.1 DNA photolyase family protein [Acidobacteriota bacterium]